MFEDLQVKFMPQIEGIIKSLEGLTGFESMRLLDLVKNQIHDQLYESKIKTDELITTNHLWRDNPLFARPAV